MVLKKITTMLKKSKRGSALIEATLAAGIFAFVATHVLAQFIHLAQYIDQSAQKVDAMQQAYVVNEVIQAEGAIHTTDGYWENWLSNTFGVQPLAGADITVTTSYDATLDFTDYKIRYEYDHCGHTHYVELHDAL